LEDYKNGKIKREDLVNFYMDFEDKEERSRVRRRINDLAERLGIDISLAQPKPFRRLSL